MFLRFRRPINLVENQDSHYISFQVNFGLYLKKEISLLVRLQLVIGLHRYLCEYRYDYK